MIIVTQDKDGIINMDKVLKIFYMEDEKDGDMTIWALLDLSHRPIWLGDYETEERALEIINEITIAYSDFNTYKVYPDEPEKYMNLLRNRYNKFDVYEMPED